MNVGGGGLTLPAPLQLAPVAVPQPMQMTQPIPMASMYQAPPRMVTAPLPDFASQHMHHGYNYNPMLLQDFATIAAHRQMPMSPISPDETRV